MESTVLNISSLGADQDQVNSLHSVEGNSFGLESIAEVGAASGGKARSLPDEAKVDGVAGASKDGNLAGSKDLSPGSHIGDDKAPIEDHSSDDSDSDREDQLKFMVNPVIALKPVPIQLQPGSRYLDEGHGELYEEMRKLCAAHLDTPYPERREREAYSISVVLIEEYQGVNLHMVIPKHLMTALQECNVVGMYVMAVGTTDDTSWKTRSLKFFFRDLDSANIAIKRLNDDRDRFRGKKKTGLSWTLRYPNGKCVRNPDAPPHKKQKWSIPFSPPFYAPGCLIPARMHTQPPSAFALLPGDNNIRSSLYTSSPCSKRVYYAAQYSEPFV